MEVAHYYCYELLAKFICSFHMPVASILAQPMLGAIHHMIYLTGGCSTFSLVMILAWKRD